MATMPVHPRIRGERTGAARGNVIGGGSSPHTRGTPRLRGLMLDYVRFIPAYAGNASWVQSLNPQASVHPRIRGERPRLQSTGPLVSGSSPHTRGTLRYRSCCSTTGRFIPAYAGNAFRRVPAVGRDTVHPRIRGERCIKISPRVISDGSSPHTRGTLSTRHRLPDARRFIPAYAGNARPDRMAMLTMTVHPRIRGERTLADV